MACEVVVLETSSQTTLSRGSAACLDLHTAQPGRLGRRSPRLYWVPQSDLSINTQLQPPREGKWALTIDFINK